MNLSSFDGSVFERAFQIVPLGTTQTDWLAGFRLEEQGIDAQGSGSRVEAHESAGSPTSTIFPELPDFVDSEFSYTACLSPCHSLQQRIAEFEGLCCDYILLLGHQPDLFLTLPSPFQALCDDSWASSIHERRISLSLLQLATGKAIKAAEAERSKVSKRVRAYICLLRNHTRHIQQDPQSLRSLPNPCNPTLSKSVWEKAVFEQRKAWRSTKDQDMGDDLNGGAWHDVEVTSALTGNTMLRFSVPFELENDHGFVDLVVERAATAFSAPYFCFEVMHAGVILDATLTWEDLGFPKQVQLVRRPTSLEWTEDLFEAVEAGSYMQVQEVLTMGQDPNCIIVDSALCTAIQHNHYHVVWVLIKARADINYIPSGRPGPLQTAVIHDAEACAALLLRRKADPNLPDKTRATNTPLHLAAVYGDVIFTDMLLANGANPLAKNAFESSPFTLATRGSVISLCMTKCFHEVETSDILHRHAIALQRFGLGCFASLWDTCKALHAMKPRSDLQGGSSLLASLDSTSWVRICQNRAKALDRKRKAADCLEEPDQGTLKKNPWHQIWEKSMPTCLTQRFSSVSGLAKGIRLPLPVEGWLPSDLGCMPPDFLERGILGATPASNLLKYSHPHERDGRLNFDEPSHTYYVDGIPVDCSVTQFLSAFQEPFDADRVISRMEQKTAWPRPQYLTFMHLRKAIQFAQGFPFLQPLLSLLQAHPIDKSAVCEILQQAPTHESWDGARFLLTMTRDEIKTFWKRNGEDASRRGTWAHLQCECILNAGQVTSPGPEMWSLSQFLQTSERLIAYRSEWSIWATEENLAGSVDFCATDAEGCLVLIDWKRSKNLKTKYFSFFRTMKGELSHIPDAVGWKYRLQLNLYKYVLEKYYGFSVSRMLVVDIHPDSVSNPFIDDVPDMQAEVRSILATRKRNLQSATTSDIQGADASLLIDDVMRGKIESAHDVLGGADLDKSQASMLEEESQMALAPTPSIPGALSNHIALQTQDVDIAPIVVKEEPVVSEALGNIKKRRLMKGAQASAQNFDLLFQEYRDFNAERLTLDLQDSSKDSETIASRCQQLWAAVEQKYPSWSQNLIRLGSVAVACGLTRIGSRMFIGDNAFFLWLIEGDRFIRVHSGFCYIYNGNGAFQPYSGIPPQSVLFRVCTFFTHLEGIFHRMSPSTPKTEEGILRAIAADLARFETEDLFLESCTKAAVFGEQKDWQELDELRLQDEDFDEGREMPGPPMEKRKVAWTIALGKTVWKVCQSLRGDMMHDKLISLLVEWCETPSASAKCVSYTDTCIMYDTSQEQPVQHVRKSALNNCYTFIPHPLLDPVLRVYVERLQKFYAQTFWANQAIFLCNQAALALAKRGVNVDRCFIGKSPGGVGQSLFSLHLASMLGHNHGFFDPNVWFNEDELRKQVESYARCIVITGQEAPESHKKLHLDLFKKTVSGDGIAGRKPYGYTTRMFEIVGWKRLEVNKMMTFVGIDDSNFQSVFRRSLVWKPKARFYHETVLQNLHEDHESDGLFLADPSLKQFLASQPASAAGLKIQHAFESQHSQEACLKLIDDYATGGDDYLTEDKMRTSCGLKLRVRHADTVDAGVGVLEIGNSQNDREEAEAKFEKAREVIISFLLQNAKPDLTFSEFAKGKIPLTDESMPNMTKTQMWQDMQEKQMLIKSKRRGTRAMGVMQPVLRIQRKLADIIVLERCDPKPFPETRNLCRLRQYLKEVTRMANNETMLQHLQAKKTATKRPGRQSCVDTVCMKEIENSIKKLQVYEKACASLLELQKPAGCSPLRLRAKSSSADASADSSSSYSVRYLYPDNRQCRCRRYVHGMGAQMCAQRLQYHLFSHTSDLDIRNACLCIAFQLLEKAQPQPPLPDEVLKVLKQWLESREEVCRDVLKISVSEGKRVVNVVINGGTPPTTLKDNSFIQCLQRASIYFRWFACSLLPDDYKELEDREDKDFPSATVFHYMWTAVEDYILEHWCNFLQRHAPTHLSLHFDGVRVNSDLHEDMCALMNACEKHILESTGFAVKLVEKNIISSWV